MSSFGSINFPTSRALWEDDDNFEKLEWSDNFSIPDKYSLLILAEGVSATEYVQRCILPNAEYTRLNEIKQADFKMYKLTGSDIIVCTSVVKDIMIANDVAVLLKPILEACDKVLILKTNPLAEYNSGGRNPEVPCIIRALYTDSTEQVPDVKRLEQPNIVSGLSAGVLCLRGHLNLPASLYVCYTDTLRLDSIIADQISVVLKKSDITINTKFQPKIDLQSNLYI